MCRQVASIFAEASLYCGRSSPKRETALGWSWLSQNRLFHATPYNSVCQRDIICFNSTRDGFSSFHFPYFLPLPKSTCSNWNTIFSSWVSSPAYCFASSVVTFGVSPTVMISYLDRTFSFISCKYLWTFGPLTA